VRKRKKKDDHGGGHERWLVSYADFITLLFAFFVVMYALSVQDLAKVKAAAQSIRQAFGGPAVLPAGSGSGMRDGARINPFGEPAQCPPCAGDSAPPPASDEAREAAQARAELGGMQTELEEAARVETAHSDLGERMDTLVDRRGLVIRLSAKDFFAPGEAGVRQDLQPLLDRIGRVIARSDRPVRIEGYSDASEKSSPGYASSWDLSAARAAWVARYWIARFKLDPRRVGVAGYAHYRPLPVEDGSPSASRSEWARAKNRRIEIVVER
jgi:chemotaxis protein MotB